MRGRYGTSMTVIQVRRRQPVTYERADRLCPICFSVAGQPCRTVKSPKGATNLKLGAALTRIHPQRRDSGQRPAAADTTTQTTNRREPRQRPARERRPVPGTAEPPRRDGARDPNREPAKTTTNQAPVVRAKHPGTCPACKGGWRAGTLITLRGDTWIHRLCANGDRSAPKWTREDTPEARAYRLAAARGDRFLPRRRAAWR